MGWFKPFELLIIPAVFLVAIPLAICACLTTGVAFLVLFCRLFFVYFDLAIDTIRYVILGRSVDVVHAQSSPSTRTTTPAPGSPNHASARRRRSRRDSASSNISLDGATLTLGSSALERDYEGVGGWRLKKSDTDSAEVEEQQWLNMNSRLDLPVRRHHFRTQSGPGGDIASGFGSAIGLYGMKTGSRGGPPSPESIRMTTSPNHQRARTPGASKSRGFVRLGQEGYFPPYESRPARRIAV